MPSSAIWWYLIGYRATVRVTWVRARGSKQGWYCLRMYFTEHQTMRSSQCQATDSAFNLVSHFAYDVLYNSVSLLGKMNLKQEQSKYRKELRDVIKERNSTSPSCVGLFKQINIALYLCMPKLTEETYRMPLSWDHWQKLVRCHNSCRYLPLSLVTSIWFLGLT